MSCIQGAADRRGTTAAKAGFKVDLQATDWQTVVTRRASQKPPKEGGWNMFFTNFIVADVVNPIVNILVSGKGGMAAGSAGRKTAQLEALKERSCAPPRRTSRRRSRQISRRRSMTR